MKRILMNTTALIGAGAVTSTMGGFAHASDGIKLEVGGFFRTAYMVNFDDNDNAHGTHPADLGHDRAIDGVFSDAEIFFKGEVTLDNGLKVGARVELEGEESTDQIDEAYVYFSGGFGKFEIGSDDEALRQSCVTPPGGTTNFGAFSPNQWAANDSTPFANSNPICQGVDDKSDSQKLIYFTPNYSGFQLVVSYTPTSNKENQTGADNVGPHIGMPTEDPGASRHNFSAYAIYQYKGDGWGVQWGGGGTWEGQVEHDPTGNDRNRSDFYQTGLNVNFGGFKIGAAFEYMNDFATVSATDHSRDAWIAGGGVSYKFDAWTVGAQYSHGNFETATADIDDDTLDRLVLTGRYDMGPGISLDAEVGYTWEGSEESEAKDNYDSLELGIGTAFNF